MLVYTRGLYNWTSRLRAFWIPRAELSTRKSPSSSSKNTLPVIQFSRRLVARPSGSFVTSRSLLATNSLSTSIINKQQNRATTTTGQHAFKFSEYCFDYIIFLYCVPPFLTNLHMGFSHGVGLIPRLLDTKAAYHRASLVKVWNRWIRWPREFPGGR